MRERYLDSVVAGVADENESLAIKENSTRIFELTVESAFSTNRLLVLSRRREDLYPDSRKWIHYMVIDKVVALPI